MKKSAKRSFQIVFWVIVFAIVIVAIAIYWHRDTICPSTDDAYVQANIVHIAPQINGPVDKVLVKNYQYVKKGQLLFTVDPRPFVLAVKTASAKLALAKQSIDSDKDQVASSKNAVASSYADLILAENNSKRIMKLVKDGQMSKQDGDKTQDQLKVAEANFASAKNQLRQAIAELGSPGEKNANLRQAKANLADAKLDLSYTKVYAPEAGQLANFTLRPGNMLATGQQVFSIVENNTWWLSANFKETQLNRIHPNQKAKIVLDMYPDHTFYGKVAHLSPGSGSAFSLLPPENASGNWVKVTQRFPIKVIIIGKPNPHYPLRVGASATVTVDTTSS